MEKMKNKVGIALSGGGFRAAAFHLGTLRKLKELNILDDVEVISTISGGSIVGANYVLNKEDFAEFERKFRIGLKRSMLTKGIFFLILVLIVLLVLPFALAAIGWYYLFLFLPVIFLILRYQFNMLPFSRWIENKYDKVFFQGRKLKDLPETPKIAINATNVETGRPFTFSKEKMSDSYYEYSAPGRKSIKFLHSDFPLARTVMASTCVPFAFTPIKIDKKYFADKKDFHLIDPCLIDGGVYDNQGIHKLTHTGSSYECDTIIVSDAGTGFKPITKMNNTIMLLMQTSDLFMNRIKNVQYINNIILNKYLSKKSIAYFSLSYEPEECIGYFVDLAKNGKIQEDILYCHHLDEESLSKKSKAEIIEYLKAKIGYSKIEKSFPTNDIRSIARNVGTNLTPLNDEKIDALISVSEVLTELQVRLYCPHLING